MNKKLKFLLMFVGVLILASPAFAMQCKAGNDSFGDECWTDIIVSPIETSPVSIGTMLVYDYNAGDPQTSAFQVRVASASADAYRVAGFAQRVIATGDRGRVLMRGHGQVIASGVIASGDRLFSNGVRYGSVSVQGPPTNVASHDKVLAFAIEAQSGTGLATTDAFITIV